MKLNPYSSSNGQCRDAFESYEKIFDSLGQDGQVQMPFQATFWAKGFGP